MDRRQAVKAAAIVAGGLAIGTLTGCSSQSATDRIDSANREIISNLDLSETRLPLGSVVELEYGNFMVIGQMAAWYSGASDEYRCFDYYGIAWPSGACVVGSESSMCACFNASDVKNVVFIGLVNDEDRDFRDYAAGYDPVGREPVHHKRGDGAQLVTGASGLLAKEQAARMDGKRSEELYGAKGNEFRGGLVYADGSGQ